MAKRNPINVNTVRSLESRYGSGATKSRKGAASPAMANIMQDKREGRNPTSSLTKYAGGESRAVYVNGQRQKGGAAANQRKYNNLLKNAGSKTYSSSSLFS